jgi:F-type H+-transporting ATPase subunit alpha
MPVEEQVVVVYAVTEGHTDDVAVKDIGRFETELLASIRTRHQVILDQIRDTGNLPEGDALGEAIDAFTETFEGSAGE